MTGGQVSLTDDQLRSAGELRVGRYDTFVFTELAGGVVELERSRTHGRVEVWEIEKNGDRERSA